MTFFALDGQKRLGLLDLVALEAAGAYICTLCPAIFQDANALDVGVEAALGGNHRVAAVLTERWLLAASDADLRHNRSIIAGSRPYRKQQPAAGDDAHGDEPIDRVAC